MTQLPAAGRDTGRRTQAQLRGRPCGPGEGLRTLGLSACTCKVGLAPGSLGAAWHLENSAGEGCHTHSTESNLHSFPAGLQLQPSPSKRLLLRPRMF